MEVAFEGLKFCDRLLSVFILSIQVIFYNYKCGRMVLKGWELSYTRFKIIKFLRRCHMAASPLVFGLGGMLVKDSGVYGGALFRDLAC